MKPMATTMQIPGVKHALLGIPRRRPLKRSGVFINSKKIIRNGTYV